MKKLKKKKRRRVIRLPVEVRETIRRGGPHSTPKGGKGYNRQKRKKIPPDGREDE